MPAVITYSGVLGPYSPITFTRASTATYFNASGVLTTAAVNEGRLDYDPSTLAPLGFLVEEARTNLSTNSVLASAWGAASNASYANTQALAPDGTNTAWKLTEDLVNSSHFGSLVNISTTYTSGTAYTVSRFLKASGRNVVTVYLPASNFATPGRVATFNLTTGVVVSTDAGVTATIQNIGNGWYRCSASAVATVTGSGHVGGSALTNNGVDIYQGDGVSGAFVWGHQLEAGAFPTSYIPTTTTALTRSADVASVNTLSPWYNATASTLYTEFTSPVPTTVTASAVVAGFDDGTANNRFSNFYTSNTSVVAANQTTGGTPNYNIVAASGVTLSNVQKQATRFQAGSYASSANGAAAVTDSFASAPPTVNTLRFGLRPSGTQANMWLRRVTVYPRGLSNAELVSITT